MAPSAKFLLGLASGVIGLVIGLAVAFVALDEAGRLKAPAFANRLSFDEKMRYLRGTDVSAPEVLLVGSSTTLHGVDGGVLKDVLGLENAVVNLGVQDLRINQSRFVADTFLPRYDSVEHVVMVSTTLDFKDCTTTNTDFFDPQHVLDYLEGGSEIFYHFKYLDVPGVFERAREIERLRDTRADLESVSFDDYGGLLLDVPRERVSERVWRGDPITFDPACYEQLRALAEDLEERDIQFTYVIAPMRPGYLADRDPDGRLLAQHRRTLDETLGSTQAAVIDAHAELDMPETAFFDAYHLNPDKAKKLTRYVGERMALRFDRVAHEGTGQPEPPDAADLEERGG